jgi:hypothetical protein
MNHKYLKVRTEDRVGWIEYNRPPVNAFNWEMLREDQHEYLKTITFYVNPDQLSVLMLGAQYNSAPGDPLPVIAPFGSGCMELVPLFEDLNIPQAMIGATDIAMRQNMAPVILAFTVTKPMFKQLCELDEKSFLYKPFWKNLRKARGLRYF